MTDTPHPYSTSRADYTPLQAPDGGTAQAPNVVHTPVTMTFSDALMGLKAGWRVARLGWNGKGMFLFLVPGSTFEVNRAPLNQIYPEGTRVNYHAHVDMRTATGEIVPWLASQTDLLAEDWVRIR